MLLLLLLLLFLVQRWFGGLGEVFREGCLGRRVRPALYLLLCLRLVLLSGVYLHHRAVLRQIDVFGVTGLGGGGVGGGGYLIGLAHWVLLPLGS